jgi:hypothetical protein
VFNGFRVWVTAGAESWMTKNTGKTFKICAKVVNLFHENNTFGEGHVLDPRCIDTVNANHLAAALWVRDYARCQPDKLSWNGNLYSVRSDTYHFFKKNREYPKPDKFWDKRYGNSVDYSCLP